MMLKVRDTELFVARHGHGRPMLTLHGSGFDHMMLRPWLDALGGSCELIYFDQRCCGRSRRDDVAHVTEGTWAEDADAVRRALGFERVVVFGHSYGGCVAQEYALRFPDRVRALILCATAPAFDYPEAMMANARSRATPHQFDVIVKSFSAPMKDDRMFKEAWKTILPVYFHRYSPDLGEAVSRDIQYRAAILNRTIFDLLPKFNTVSRLRDIHAPTLVIAGASDWITPPEHAASRLAEGIPDADYAIFDQSGHFPFVEERDLFTSRVHAFLKTLL